MLSRRRKQLIQAAEYLKEHVRATVVAFRDGVGDPSAPFTADLAIKSIWNEIDNVFAQDRACTASFRIAIAPEGVQTALKALGLRLLSVQVLGPRGKETNTVCYVAAEAATHELAADAVKRAVDAGAEVRDWSFRS